VKRRDDARKKPDDIRKLGMEAYRKAEACPVILWNLSACAPGPEPTPAIATLIACHRLSKVVVLVTAMVIPVVPALDHLVLAGFSMLESGFRDPSGCCHIAVVLVSLLCGHVCRMRLASLSWVLHVGAGLVSLRYGLLYSCCAGITAGVRYTSIGLTSSL